MISSQAYAGWRGDAGHGPSSLDKDSGGLQNDFTNRNTTFMSWNLMHTAKMLFDHEGILAQTSGPNRMPVPSNFTRIRNTVPETLKHDKIATRPELMRQARDFSYLVSGRLNDD
ncbi:hypothetical protein OKW21_001688 [Catalinimonas alkaloidigena]|uniref:hypothetical protein n=1 Tax=Catalinimonas alkaloidigena TaxID=1075417 RepID=UPI002406070E|nr:hypothetical protein [Catalinimonas alkaloidigena]MDF9796425.1 hypothetical protein [Catalinimonas alkaloidigena]